MMVPQIIHFNRVFHYKPSISGYPYFWKHPFAWICLCSLAKRFITIECPFARTLWHLNQMQVLMGWGTEICVGFTVPKPTRHSGKWTFWVVDPWQKKKQTSPFKNVCLGGGGYPKIPHTFLQGPQNGPGEYGPYISPRESRVAPFISYIFRIVVLEWGYAFIHFIQSQKENGPCIPSGDFILLDAMLFCYLSVFSTCRPLFATNQVSQWLTGGLREESSGSFGFDINLWNFIPCAFYTPLFFQALCSPCRLAKRSWPNGRKSVDGVKPLDGWTTPTSRPGETFRGIYCFS